MTFANETQITPPRVSLVDERTGAVSREWYRWFYSLYNILGAGTGVIPVNSGGTGLGTIPINGQLLIGNGTGYTLNTLGYGVGISVTNGAGTIVVANTGVLSNIAGTGISVSGATGNVTIGNTGVLSIIAGTGISASSTTGNVTLSNTGVLSWSGGSTGLTPATATTGAVTLGGLLAIGYGGTNSTATPTAGAVAYGTGAAYNFTSAGTVGQYLQSTGTSAPTWSSISSGVGSAGYYGLLISTTNQANGGATVANVVALDSSAVLSNGVSVVSGNRITFANAGQYHIINELAYINSTGSNPIVSVWLAKNGSNIANSGQDLQFVGGANNVQLSVCSWILDIVAGDYVQIYWSCSATTVSLAYQAALTSPTRPASPSAIVNVFSLPQIGIGYYGLTSATSTTIGTGSKTFTTNLNVTGTAFAVGTRVRVAYTTTPANFMEGVITAYSTTSMTVNVDSTGGSGTYAAWSISVAGIQGNSGLTVNTTTVSGGTTGNILYDNAGTVGELAPAALTKTDDTNVTMTLGGTPTTALLKAASMTLGWTGQLAVSRGGTGVATATANYVFAGPTSGAAAAPSFRALTSTDIPTLSYVSSVGATAPITSTGGLTPTIGVTAAALTKTDDTNVTATLGGSPTTALLAATSLTLGWTGQLAVSRGGTGLSAGTSGGVPYFSSTSTIASSALLTQYGVVYGGGAGAAPVATAAGTTGQVLTATTGGAPTWANPATSGTVTSVSVVSANGFAGTVATATTTPAITLTTTITGLLKGNGTAISAAVANTDYVPLSTVITKTADYTITGTDTWIINNKTGSALTLTFPAASSWTGRYITVKNMQAQAVNSASSNIVPIDSTTAGTAILLGVVGNWATMVSDGTNWIIMQAASNNNLLLE